MPLVTTATHPHRMRDLVRLTGTAAPTIHFYAQQGLLPEARKTAGNQALYSEATVSRILWIRALQHELRLPLRNIRWILEQWGELPLEEVRALQTLGRLLEEPDPHATAEEISGVLQRLPTGDVEALRALGLVAEAGLLTSADLRLVELVAGMRAAGFTEEAGFSISNLALYRDAVEKLVEDEFARIIEPVVGRHDPERLGDLVRSGLPLANQLLVLLHQRALQSQLQRWRDAPEASADRTTVA